LRRGGNAVDEEKRLNWISKKKEEFANATAEHAKAALEVVLTTAEAAKSRDIARSVLEEFREEIFVKPSSDNKTKQCTTADTNSDDCLSVQGNSTETSQESAENSGSLNQITQESYDTNEDLKRVCTFLCCLNMEDGEYSLRTYETPYSLRTYETPLL
jgi:hypothetical protein